MKVLMGLVSNGEMWVRLQHYQQEDISRLRSGVPGGRWEHEGKCWRYLLSVEHVRRVLACFPEGGYLPSDELTAD